MNNHGDWATGYTGTATAKMVGVACLIGAALVLAGWLLFSWAAADYRQQHCVLLFGHWIAVDTPAGHTSAFCQ